MTFFVSACTVMALKILWFYVSFNISTYRNEYLAMAAGARSSLPPERWLPSPLSCSFSTRWYLIFMILISDTYYLFVLLPSSESHEMSIISWSWNGDTSGTTNICMAQLVCELLEFISVKVIIIPKYVVMTWSRCALNTWNDYQIGITNYSQSFPISPWWEQR